MRPKPLELYTEAERDYLSALDWYLSQNMPATGRFEDAFWEAIQLRCRRLGTNKPDGTSGIVPAPAKSARTGHPAKGGAASVVVVKRWARARLGKIKIPALSERTRQGRGSRFQLRERLGHSPTLLAWLDQ
jgi:hypothetical protein